MAAANQPGRGADDGQRTAHGRGLDRVHAERGAQQDVPGPALQRGAIPEHVQHPQVVDGQGSQPEAPSPAQSQTAQEGVEAGMRETERDQPQHGVPVEGASFPVARQPLREVGDRVVKLSEGEGAGRHAGVNGRHEQRERARLQREHQLHLLVDRVLRVVVAERGSRPPGNDPVEQGERQEETAEHGGGLAPGEPGGLHHGR